MDRKAYFGLNLLAQKFSSDILKVDYKSAIFLNTQLTKIPF